MRSMLCHCGYVLHGQLVSYYVAGVTRTKGNACSRLIPQAFPQDEPQFCHLVAAASECLPPATMSAVAVVKRQA